MTRKVRKRPNVKGLRQARELCKLHAGLISDDELAKLLNLEPSSVRRAVRRVRVAFGHMNEFDREACELSNFVRVTQSSPRTDGETLFCDRMIAKRKAPYMAVHAMRYEEELSRQAVGIIECGRVQARRRGDELPRLIDRRAC